MNADGVFDSTDALVMYYAYALEDLLGSGEAGAGTMRFRQTLLAGLSGLGNLNPSDAELREMLRRANSFRDCCGESGNLIGDINDDGIVDSDDALVMYYAFALESLLGNGEPGRGLSRFREILLGGLAGKNNPNPSDSDLREMLRKAGALRMTQRGN